MKLVPFFTLLVLSAVAVAHAESEVLSPVAPEVLEDIPLMKSSLALNADQGFVSALVASFCIIVVSEIGDKTFFIAALLAMKRGALVTFSGAASALAIMTLLSALVGRALPALLDPKYTRVASILLFLFFGAKLIYEGYKMESETGAEAPAELVEVEQALAAADEKKEVDIEGSANTAPTPHPLALILPEWIFAAVGTDLGKPCATPNWMRVIGFVTNLPLLFVSGAFVEAFSLTFAAEWGDRSQIATFALGASKNFVGVNVGAILGHFSCTAGAVIGGKVLATRVSERFIAFIGGVTFLVFALLSVIY